MEAALRGAYNDARKSVHEIAHSYMLWNEPHAGRFLRITIKPSNTYERRNSCSSAASATGTTGTVICTTGQKHPNNADWQEGPPSSQRRLRLLAAGIVEREERRTRNILRRNILRVREMARHLYIKKTLTAREFRTMMGYAARRDQVDENAAAGEADELNESGSIAGADDDLDEWEEFKLALPASQTVVPGFIFGPSSIQTPSPHPEPLYLNQRF
uniref:Uncharacterized protein n=1 Tax=Globodera rostochiensis TaxID=31243 RepID=A0A914HCW0_GLORO